jgi:hypothetical protein
MPAPLRSTSPCIVTAWPGSSSPKRSMSRRRPWQRSDAGRRVGPSFDAWVFILRAASLRCQRTAPCALPACVETCRQLRCPATSDQDYRPRGARPR